MFTEVDLSQSIKSAPPDELKMGGEPQVDVYVHIIFRECERECKPLKGNISERSFCTITGGPEQSRSEFLHLEVQFESVLMNLGALAFFSLVSPQNKS